MVLWQLTQATRCSVLKLGERVELLRRIIGHGHRLWLVGATADLVEWLMTRMVALRTRDDHALIDMQTAEVDVAVTVAIEHCAVNG